MSRYTDEEQLEIRMEPIVGEQFQALMDFENSFCDALIERGCTDDDALAYAKMFDGKGSFAPVFAALLRRVPTRRIERDAFHRAEAVFAKHPTLLESRGCVSWPEINQLYRDMGKGEA